MGFLNLVFAVGKMLIKLTNAACGTIVAIFSSLYYLCSLLLWRNTNFFQLHWIDKWMCGNVACVHRFHTCTFCIFYLVIKLLKKERRNITKCVVLDRHLNKIKEGELCAWITYINTKFQLINKSLRTEKEKATTNARCGHSTNWYKITTNFKWLPVHPMFRIQRTYTRSVNPNLNITA